MKIELQKIISEMKSDLSRRQKIYNSTGLRQNAYDYARGEITYLDKYIEKLELLLDSEIDKIGKNDADNIGKPV